MKTKPPIQLILLVLKTVLKIKKTFCERITLILKTIFGDNIFMLIAKRIK